MAPVRAVIFGATGMIGQGVLRASLLDDAVEAVTAVGRNATGQAHAKLREVVPPDLWDLSPLADELSGFDACFFCLGVSAAGMSEAEYRRATYDLTLAVARVLAPANPGLRFVYVSGAGTDSTERGRMMWARVKGATENALLAMPMAATMVRPGFVLPTGGVRSRTGWYRAMYALLGPAYPVLRRLFPGAVTSTDELSRAMLRIGRYGSSKRVLTSRDLNALAAHTGPQ
jgi:uncharacterized protein YbjT (DUF2867 family)